MALTVYKRYHLKKFRYKPRLNGVLSKVFFFPCYHQPSYLQTYYFLIIISCDLSYVDFSFSGYIPNQHMLPDWERLSAFKEKKKNEARHPIFKIFSCFEEHQIEQRFLKRTYSRLNSESDQREAQTSS